MVREILLDNEGKVTGVVNADGREIKAPIVLSNATAKVTFLNLLPKGCLPVDFENAVRKIDYTSPVTKINGEHCFSLNLISVSLIFCVLILHTDSYSGCQQAA